MMIESGNLSGEIKWAVGEDNDQAKLRFSESGQEIKIETIIVPASCRGQGIGSQLMQRVIECANLSGKDVLVSARPLGGRTNPQRLERLVRFYRKLGFEEIERGVTVCHMRRPADLGNPH